MEDTLDVLSEPSRWCQGSWAIDAEGKRVPGPIVEAVEADAVVARCVFAELLHQGLRRAFRIEVIPPPREVERIEDLIVAPATFMVAVTALNEGAIAAITRFGLFDAAWKIPGGLRGLILPAVIANENATDHDQIVWMLQRAIGWLDQADTRVEGSR